jgi:hypothetical protein
MPVTTIIADDARKQFEFWYEQYQAFEGDPTVIIVHEVWDSYGGPEEGGWYYTSGWPVENVCIFDKEQAIKELQRLHDKYANEEETYDIRLSRGWGKPFPEKRPHYE